MIFIIPYHHPQRGSFSCPIVRLLLVPQDLLFDNSDIMAGAVGAVAADTEYMGQPTSAGLNSSQCRLDVTQLGDSSLDLSGLVRLSGHQGVVMRTWLVVGGRLDCRTMYSDVVRWRMPITSEAHQQPPVSIGSPPHRLRNFDLRQPPCPFPP